MPEATVDEDSNTVPLENDIWLVGNPLGMERPPAHTREGQKGANPPLGRFIPIRSDRAHIPATDCARGDEPWQGFSAAPHSIS
jgi:hypothetical protein